MFNKASRLRTSHSWKQTVYVRDLHHLPHADQEWHQEADQLQHVDTPVDVRLASQILSYELFMQLQLAVQSLIPLFVQSLIHGLHHTVDGPVRIHHKQVLVLVHQLLVEGEPEQNVIYVGHEECPVLLQSPATLVQQSLIHSLIVCILSYVCQPCSVKTTYGLFGL